MLYTCRETHKKIGNYRAHKGFTAQTAVLFAHFNELKRCVCVCECGCGGVDGGWGWWECGGGRGGGGRENATGGLNGKLYNKIIKQSIKKMLVHALKEGMLQASKHQENKHKYSASDFNAFDKKYDSFQT